MNSLELIALTGGGNTKTLLSCLLALLCPIVPKSHLVKLSLRLFFLFWRTSVLFVWPLVSLFWTSGDVCPGLQNLDVYPHIHLLSLACNASKVKFTLILMSTVFRISFGWLPSCHGHNYWKQNSLTNEFLLYSAYSDSEWAGGPDPSADAGPGGSGRDGRGVQDRHQQRDHQRIIQVQLQGHFQDCRGLCQNLRCVLHRYG